MQSIFAFLSLFFFLIFFAFVAGEVIFIFLFPNSNANGDLPKRILDWLVIALWSLPTVLSTVAGNILTHVGIYWKFYAFAVAAVAFNYAWSAEQGEILKTYDGHETSVLYPFNKDVLVPSVNIVRLAYGGSVCLINTISGGVRYVRWSAYVAARDCSAYNGSTSIDAASKIPVAPVLSIRDFILSGFSDNLDVTPMINAYADTMTTFDPLMKCECNAISPVFPMLLDKDYGILQSAHLHAVSDVYINWGIEIIRTHTTAAIDIVDRIAGKCDSAIDERECRVTRGPNYDKLADMSCELITHPADFLDDTLNAIFSGLEEDPWGVQFPWGANPRPFAMFAMPVCAVSDYFFLALDAVSHVDMFFTLPGDNYAKEIRYERPLSRLYNISTHITALGDSFATQLSSDIACVFARAIRIIVSAADAISGLLRSLLESDFDVGNVSSYLNGSTMEGILATMQEDSEQISLCVVRIGDLLGHGVQTVLYGIARGSYYIVKIFRDMVTETSSSNILTFLASDEIQDDVDNIITSANMIASGVGGSLRQLGAFGSVECSIRNLTVLPNDLTPIRTDSMNLNIMCAIGTTLEMYIRLNINFVGYAANAIIAFAKSAEITFSEGFSPPTALEAISLIISDFGPNGALDLAKEDGVIEHVCMLADSASMIIPSFTNMGKYTVKCPGDENRHLSDVLWNVLRAFVRLAIAPFEIINTWLRVIYILGSATSHTDFENSCNAIFVPMWHATVSPLAQIALEGPDLATCVVPSEYGLNNAITQISKFAGDMFIDTNYDPSDFSDCGEIAQSDGGIIVASLCAFTEKIEVLLQLIIDIFEDGVWQALANLILPTLNSLVDAMREVFECIWNNVTSIFEKIADCGSALIDIDELPDDYFTYVRDKCGDWNEVFSQCHIDFEIPVYNVDSEYPTSGGPSAPPPPPLVSQEIRGSCCAADVCTGPFPIIEGGPNGGGDPINPQQCSAIPTGINVNVFVPGETCPEQETCNGISTNASVYFEIGACCFSETGGGACQEMTYESCLLSANLSSLEDGVFIPGERCSNLNSQCNIRFSPNSRQIGCCVQEVAVVDPFNTHIKREYVEGVSGDACYHGQREPSLYRPFYIPGDSDCSVIRDQSGGYGDSLINGSDSVLAVEYQSCIPETDLDIENQITDDFGIPSAIGTDRGDVFQFLSSACRISHSMVSTGIFQPLDAAYVGLLTTEAPIGTNCTELTTGRTWCCRETGDPMIYSQAPITFPFTNTWISLDHILEGDDRNGGIGNFRSLPFADGGAAMSFSPAQKSTAALSAFTIRGLIGGTCEACAFNLGTCAGCTPDTTAVLTGAQTSTLYHVITIEAKPPIVLPVIQYPQYGPKDSPFADILVQPDRTMRIIFLANASEMTEARYNMDRDCEVFFYPKDAPILPLTAPDEEEDQNVQTIGARDTIGTRNTIGTRDTVWIPVPPGDLDFYKMDPREPDHPCHIIYLLANDTDNRPAESYLIKKELGLCSFSSMLTYGLDHMLFPTPQKRILHPLLFTDFRIQWTTMVNITQGITLAFRHTSEVIKEEARMASNYSGNVSFPNITREWVEYASENGISENIIGVRVGQLISFMANHTIGLTRGSLDIPGFLAPLSLQMQYWMSYYGDKNTIYKEADYKDPVPILSESGTQLLSYIWNTSWVNISYSTSYSNLYSNSNLYSYSYSHGSSGQNETLYYSNSNSSSQSSQSFSANVGMGIKNSLLPIFYNPVALMEYGATERHMSFHPRSGSPGNEEICDPRDAECVDCFIVSESMVKIVDQVLNCVEDLQDIERFSLDVSDLALARNNTFDQPSDPHTCINATLSRTFTSHDPTGIGAWIVDSLGIRDFLGRMMCYAKNTDVNDPESPRFWVEKLIYCDAAIDGSCHRGRAGIGLWNAVFYVTIVFAALALFSQLYVPVLPSGILFGTLWLLSVMSSAYFWSPSCILPFVVLPDCIADDIFVSLRRATEGNCRDYGDMMQNQSCTNDGRKFPECHSDPLNFDVTGFRHFFYVLDMIPKMTEFLQSTDFVLLSWVRQLYVTRRALDGIGDIRGTPDGDACFAMNILSLASLVFVALGALAVLLISISLIAIIIVLLAFLTSLIVRAISALTDLLARVNVDTSRFYRLN